MSKYSHSWALVKFIPLALVFVGLVLATKELHSYQPNTLTVAMSLTPLSSPFIIAEDQGYFVDQGLNVIIKDFIGGKKAAKAMLRGQADIATSSEAVIMFNSFENKDFTVIATFVSSDNDVKLITRRDTNIRNIDALKGKTIGTVVGASAHFFLDRALMLEGVFPESVTIIGLGPSELPNALVDGKVDAIAVWEPYGYETARLLKDQYVAISHLGAYVETFNVLVSRQLASEEGGDLVGLLKALKNAVIFIHENPDESKRIVAKRIGQDLSVITATWPDFHFELSLHQSLMTVMEDEARWAMERGAVTGNRIPDYLDYLDPKPLMKVSPLSVTLYQ